MLLRITAAVWVKIQNGQVVNKRGLMPVYFQQELQAIFASQQHVSGDIYASKKGNRYQLHFSRQLPENLVQRCKNVWRGYATVRNTSNLKRG
ncbi:DUF3634 family protein [Motilimonas pumila]|uniref:DUF3634 family protein n=1 Tax=Motilimonas pumila TaxID=2303987 RepID=A0A418YFN2_9GAMM|nr:DUF3634 family protein [Motilimonas pumila]RJG48193.1 DUF3634 family protein [Motilimonas pumila]